MADFVRLLGGPLRREQRAANLEAELDRCSQLVASPAIPQGEGATAQWTPTTLLAGTGPGRPGIYVYTSGAATLRPPGLTAGCLPPELTARFGR